MAELVGHQVLARLSRQERRAALDGERRARRSGDWGPWERLSFPKGSVHPVGWPAEFDTAYRNRCFCVLYRMLPDGVIHLGISSLTQARPTWWEAQRIKDEIAGPTQTAVEVYPPHDEIVDAADMYHLWVLTAPLPFSLKRGEQ